MRHVANIAILCVSATAGAEENGHKRRAMLEQAGWDYSNPSSWYQQGGSSDYSECRNHRQSPIELKTGESQEGSPGFLKVWMPRTRSAIGQVVNNGHTIKVDVENLGVTLTAGHLWSQYKLSHMNYHAPSEHVIDGKRYPLERHMVFVPADSEELEASGQTRYPLAIIGELFEQDERSGHEDKMIDEMIRGGLNSQFTSNSPPLNMAFEPRFDVSHEEFFTYDGSLTTPPCSEVVSWHVVRKPRSISQNQLRLMLELMQGMPDNKIGGNPPPSPRYPMSADSSRPHNEQVIGNARPLLPNNGRRIVRRRFYGTD